MSANRSKCPVHEENPKRSTAKAKRGFGKLEMEKAGMDHSAWTRKFDPLYQIKGKERYARLHQC